jgi:hypothetical protein
VKKVLRELSIHERVLFISTGADPSPAHHI